MTYRICYDDCLVTGARNREVVRRTEYFRTEFEALRRARRLIEGGDHHGVGGGLPVKIGFENERAGERAPTVGLISLTSSALPPVP